MIKDANQTISVTLSKAIVDKLNHKAIVYDRSRGYIAAKIIKDYFGCEEANENEERTI